MTKEQYMYKRLAEKLVTPERFLGTTALEAVVDLPETARVYQFPQPELPDNVA